MSNPPANPFPEGNQLGYKGGGKYGKDTGYYMDGWLYSNMNYLVARNSSNFDSIVLITGLEGTGKSTIAAQLAKYFLVMKEKIGKEDNIPIEKYYAFTPEEFLERLRNAEMYDTIVYDEAYDGLASAFFHSTKQKEILDIFHKIRKKRLFIIVVCSVFFELRKYVAVHRSNCLIHVYEEYIDCKDNPVLDFDPTGMHPSLVEILKRIKVKRGKFRFYGGTAKRILYFKGKNQWDLDVISSDFVGNFGSAFPLNLEDYEKAKDKSIQYSNSTERLLEESRREDKRKKLPKEDEK